MTKETKTTVKKLVFTAVGPHANFGDKIQHWIQNNNNNKNCIADVRLPVVKRKRFTGNVSLNINNFLNFGPFLRTFFCLYTQYSSLNIA